MARAMKSTETAVLEVGSRAPSGSRATRRLRRDGFVPGVIYGGGDDAVPFQIEATALRHALAHSGALISVSVDGGEGSPVVLKERQLHPVRGETVHLDLLRVHLDEAIHVTVAIELEGVESAPGVKLGGVLEHVTREVMITALPGAIPDSIVHDVSDAVIGDIIGLSAVRLPEGVTLVGDADEVVLATLLAPRVQAEEEEEIETETERVGEGAQAEPESGGE